MLALVQTALGVAAALVALAFAMSTFERWLGGRRRHELAWSVALLQFSLASACLAAGAAVGWNGALFRLFYLFGAITNVPFLAVGTVYLLADARVGDRCAAGVALAAAFAAGVLVATPLAGPITTSTLPRGSEVLGPLPRVLAGVASGGGALVVLLGAAWSAWRYRHGPMLWANVLIAAGTAVTGASGLLNSVVGEMDAFALTLLAGISVIFAGFLVATTQRTARLRALPATFRGISSTKATRVGHL